MKSKEYLDKYQELFCVVIWFEPKGIFEILVASKITSKNMCEPISETGENIRLKTEKMEGN